jgi:hypothetical protein
MVAKEINLMASELAEDKVMAVFYKAVYMKKVFLSIVKLFRITKMNRISTTLALNLFFIVDGGGWVSAAM